MKITLTTEADAAGYVRAHIETDQGVIIVKMKKDNYTETGALKIAEDVAKEMTMERKAEETITASIEAKVSDLVNIYGVNEVKKAIERIEAVKAEEIHGDISC